MGICKIVVSTSVVSELLGKGGGFSPHLISSILLSLPPNSKIIKMESLPNRGSVYNDHNIYVENPGFNDGEIIDVNYRRSALKDGKGGVVEFDSFEGLNYGKATEFREED